jgi:ribosomal protein S18 acetylase RimI-like enzyme
VRSGELTIRPFQPADQDAVRRLILAGLLEHWGVLDETRNPDLDDVQQTYVDRGHTFLVAISEGQIVGTGALLVETPLRGRIQRMSVDAGLRRSGIGRRMLAALLDVAHQRGFREVVLETTHDWYPAIALYQSRGFVEYDRDEEDVHLRLPL